MDNPRLNDSRSLKSTHTHNNVYKMTCAEDKKKEYSSLKVELKKYLFFRRKNRYQLPGLSDMKIDQ